MSLKSGPTDLERKRIEKQAPSRPTRLLLLSLAKSTPFFESHPLTLRPKKTLGRESLRKVRGLQEVVVILLDVLSYLLRKLFGC